MVLKFQYHLLSTAWYGNFSTTVPREHGTEISYHLLSRAWYENLGATVSRGLGTEIYVPPSKSQVTKFMYHRPLRARY